MSKKLSLFIPDLTVGGAERVVVNLSKGLTEIGHQVEVVVVNKKGKLVSDLSDSVNLVELTASEVRWSIVPLIRYLRTERPETVISFLTGANVVATVANNLSGMSTNLIITEHNTQTLKQDISSQLDQSLARYLYRFADHIVGVSQGVSENVTEWAHVEERDVTTIYNPVIDEDFITKEHKPPDCAWFNEAVPVIVGAGRHVEQKDFSTLIQAFDTVLSTQDARLVILGEGSLTESYRQQTSALGVSDKVSFPGFVDNPYEYLCHADVFVLSSKWEGLSLVLVEALGCGTPVVSTNCPHGPAEVLDSGEYGLLVPVERPKRMGEAILQTMREPPDPALLRTRAQDFTISRAVKEYEKLL